MEMEMRQPKIRALVLGCLSTLASLATQATQAQESEAPPAFDPREAFEHYTGLKLSGYLQVGYSANDATTHDQATAGGSNAPLTGPGDEGLQLNELKVILSKDMRTNIIPRVTPLPGPKPWEYSWGMEIHTAYGRNGLPAAMKGFDANWGINRQQAGTAPGSNRQNYLAMPQAFITAYAPWVNGMTLMLGRFGAGVGYEIAPAVRPSPNFFYSHSYMFVAQPDQVAGGLLSAHVMENEWGILGAEFGVVKGRQNWRDNNKDKSLIGALRWRSNDMDTWIDYSFMRGNEQNSPPEYPVQMPIARIISPRGQLREHHALTATFKPMQGWRAAAEIAWGRQKGDGQADTIDILTGPGFTGAQYSGVNGFLAYKLNNEVEVALRGEVLRDPKGFALFPTTAVPGTFNALTLGARWDLTKTVLFRPELRHDWQSKHNGVNAYGGGRKDKQTTLSADVVFYF
jgi:hypothetical protein